MRKYFFALLVFVLLFLANKAIAITREEEDRWITCCNEVAKKCPCEKDERGPIQVDWCGANDYFGNNANSPGATSALKACQECIDLTCPYPNKQPAKKEEEKKEEDKTLPIIFLPGVAGTNLNVNGWTAKEIWPLSYGNRAMLGLAEDGISKKLETTDTVEIGDLMDNYGKLNFYGGIENYLTGKKNYRLKEDSDGRKPNLIKFPYDWRLDNKTHFPALDKAIDQALTNNPDAKKVILLAHSMGGYIARSYILSDPARAAKVDSLITMGTPYWGSPKPFYGLVSGYTFGNPSALQKFMKLVIQNFPAAYQLMPNYPFIRDETVKDKEKWLTLTESRSIKYKGFSDVTSSWVPFYDNYVPTTDNVWSPNPKLTKLADEYNSNLGTTKKPAALPAGVRNYVIIGTGANTLHYFHMKNADPNAKQFVEVLNKKVVLTPDFGDGDGTVTLEGARLRTADKTYYVDYKENESTAHGDLPASARVMEIVGSILDGKPIDPEKYKYKRADNLADMKEGVDFTLNSDAHLRITDTATGRILGFNDEEGIVEDYPSGTFLAIEGAEYASIRDPNRALRATVTGIQDGKFSLHVTIYKGNDTTTFTYAEVPVKQGTVAEVSFTPSQVTTPPPLSVTADGQTTLVQPPFINATGGVATTTTTKPPAGASEYLGCFKDPNNPFDLDGYLERSAENTPKRCVQVCKDRGFKYAGVQFGESCLCGNSYGKFGTSDACNYPCTGDASQMCGGFNANSVYSVP